MTAAGKPSNGLKKSHPYTSVSDGGAIGISAKKYSSPSLSSLKFEDRVEEVDEETEKRYAKASVLGSVGVCRRKEGLEEEDGEDEEGRLTTTGEGEE